MTLSNEVTYALKKYKATLRIEYSFQYEIRVYIDVSIPLTEKSPKEVRNFRQTIPMEQILFSNFDLIGHTIERICKELGILV